VPVTFTVIAQKAPTTRLPPLKATDPDPATAVTVPPHVPVSPLGVVTAIPAGNALVNASPIRGNGLAGGLVIVNVRVVLAFCVMEAAAKASLMVAGTTVMRVMTLTEAVVALVLPPPFAEVTDGCGIVLVLTPADVAVTFNTTVHEAPPARVAPDRLTLPVPATAVTTPVQVPLTDGGVATTRPAGSVSANAIPVNGTRFGGAVMVKVRLTEEATAITVEPNASTIEGAETTDSWPLDVA